jgi:hypothetical protein
LKNNPTDDPGWRRVSEGLSVVELSLPVRLLVPSLLVLTLSRSTRGASFYPGKVGLGLGAAVLSASAGLSLLVGRAAGSPGILLPLWLLGTTGVAMMVNGVRPLAFVKPICVKCRLLPIIKEHESLHLAGMARESEVWDSMRARHSVESLGLEGDPSICWFCPIPKRLSEH